MSDLLERPELKYSPAEILKDDIQASKTDTVTHEDAKVADRLLDHLIAIKQWKDRVDAFDYLIKNAAKLSGKPRFKTKDVGILNAMKELGFSGDEVTFEMFKKSIDIVIDGYKQMAMVSYTGVMDGM